MDLNRPSPTPGPFAKAIIYIVMIATSTVMCGGFFTAIEFFNRNWWFFAIAIVVAIAFGYAGNYALSLLPDDEQPGHRQKQYRQSTYHQSTYHQSTYRQSTYRFPTVYPENWSQIRQEALEKDGFKCGNCGSTDLLDVHHIVPLSAGGSSELGNLKTLCRSCHSKIHPHMRD